MKFLTIICEGQTGEPSFKILERPQNTDGNPLQRFRRGIDGVLQCLVAEYGVEPDLANDVVRESKIKGCSDLTVN